MTTSPAMLELVARYEQQQRHAGMRHAQPAAEHRYALRTIEAAPHPPQQLPRWLRLAGVLTTIAAMLRAATYAI